MWWKPLKKSDDNCKTYPVETDNCYYSEGFSTKSALQWKQLHKMDKYNCVFVTNFAVSLFHYFSFERKKREHEELQLLYVAKGPQH